MGGTCPRSSPDDLARSLEAHRPLLRAIVRKLHVPSSAQEDALQAAALGFVIAYRRFDPERGTSIGSYARGFIIKEVLAAVGWSQVSVSTGVSELDDAVATDPADFERIEIAEEHAAVHRFVRQLPADEQLLVGRLYIEQTSQVMLARELGLTAMQLSRRKAALLARARAALLPAVAA